MKKFIYLFLFIFPIVSIEAIFLPNRKDAITKKLVYSKPKDLVASLTPIIAEHPLTIGESSKKGLGAKENIQFFSRVADIMPESNFIKIKATPEVAKNEIDFWGRQVSEHALFAHLGLEDPSLKKRALIIHKALEDFRAKFNRNPDDIDLMNTILPLLKVQRELQIEGIKAMESGKWIGWFFPSYFNHVTLELDYFIDKLNGIKYSPEEEVAFFNRINGEHAAFTTHFLDPAETELKNKTRETTQKFMNIPRNEKEMMIRLSLKHAKELDEFNKTAQANSKNIKSVIHDVLLNHMINEGKRSIETLENLGLRKEAEAISRLNAQELEQYKI